MKHIKYIRVKIARLYQKFRVICFRLKGYDISSTAIIERGYNFERLNPKGIHIGKNTLIASHVTILAHNFIPKNNLESFVEENIDTYIGKSCFVGIGSIILSGIKIGDSCVIGAGSVVTKDVPSNCMVAGNPAKVIKENIVMHNIKL
jgi:acetyltransferase-like isoleucine patch superfamily enzyme